MKLGTRPEPLQSAQARNTIRRNYRWMRKDGCSRITARIVIESTECAISCDAHFAAATANRARAEAAA